MSKARPEAQAGLSRIVLEGARSFAPKMSTYFAIGFYLLSVSLIGYLVLCNVPEESKFYVDFLQKNSGEQEDNSTILCLEALLALQPENMAIRYQYARFLESKKQFDDARALLDGLISLEDDTPSHDEAHWLVGKRLWLGRDGDPAKAEEAMQHLKKAVQLNPKNEFFQADLGTAYFESGNFVDALTPIQLGVRVKPELAVLLAQKILSANKNTAMDLLRRAESPLLGKLASDPGNEFLIRTVATIQVLHGKFPEAAAQLQAALNEKSSPLLKKEFADVISLQIDALFQNPPVELQQILPLIEKGLAVDPGNARLFTIMEKTMVLNSESRSAIKDKLNQLLVKGVSLALVHMMLGTDAHRAGRLDLARLHFELAHRLNPQIPELCNNLAWYLANETPRDPQKALALANQAVQLQPNNTSFLDTRGQILALAGNWKDAVADLEKALTGLSGNAGTHKSLALCYEKLGMSDLAELHRAISKKNEELRKVPTEIRRRN